jgi:hypothetical protein
MADTLLCPASVVAVVPAGVGVMLPREGDLLLGRQFLELGRGSLVLGQGSLELVWRRSCSALSAATWRERSSIPYRSALLSKWTNASEHRLGRDLGDTVRTVGCGIQAALVPTGKNGLSVVA